MVLVNCHRYCCITRERIPVDPFSSKTCRFLNSSKLPDVFSQQGASLKNACLSRYYYISQQRRFRGVWTKRELTCCTFCASLLLSGNPCTAIWIITAMNYEKECNMHVAEINWSTGSRNLFFFFLSLENKYRTSSPHRVIGLNEKFIAPSSSLNRTSKRTDIRNWSSIWTVRVLNFLNISEWTETKDNNSRVKLFPLYLHELYIINVHESLDWFARAQIHIGALPFRAFSCNFTRWAFHLSKLDFRREIPSVQSSSIPFRRG